MKNRFRVAHRSTQEDYTYSLKVSPDGKAVSIVFESETEFTNRRTIAALNGLAEQILDDCEEEDRLDG